MVGNASNNCWKASSLSVDVTLQLHSSTGARARISKQATRRVAGVMLENASLFPREMCSDLSSLDFARDFGSGL